jgi:hypothetical protein
MKKNGFVFAEALALLLVFGLVLAGCVSSELRAALEMEQEMADVDTPMAAWSNAKGAGPTLLEGTWVEKNENFLRTWVFIGNSFAQTIEMLDTPANRETYARAGAPFTPLTTKTMAWGTIEVTDSTLKLIALVVERGNARAAIPAASRPLMEYDYAVNGNEMSLFQDGQPAFNMVKQ